MGNDQSHMAGVNVCEKAVEVTDFWSHHTANINSGNASQISVFIGEPLVGGSLWVSQTPLEKASKNLMIHRHPCILRYISSWNKGSKYFLAVEDVKPLSHVISKQNVMHMCIGIHSILKALVFLHDKALVSHNNICTASIYVNKQDCWKLGGLEYLCKFADIKSEYMSKCRAHRYDKAVDPNEDKNISKANGRLDCIDVFAFAIFVQEIFKAKQVDSIPSLSSFLELCQNDLQNIEVDKRPKLNSLLEHPFFKHEFIAIHSFLTELPLKNDVEKAEFFTTLLPKLLNFDEKIVASLLGGLLVSRMVLLNKCAQSHLIPHLLNIKSGEQPNALFSRDVFIEYMIPKLLEIFCVRDAQIRLLLLEYFNNYMTCFSNDQLQIHILPELLVGIKDTNDHLVSVTLRSLADLVPLLGAGTVIGGKRAKLFNDGRPITLSSRSRSRRNSRKDESTTSTNPPPVLMDGDNLSNNSANDLELPERPSPDGEEGETTEEIEMTAEDEGADEAWDDWDINEEEPRNSVDDAEALIENLNIRLESSNVGGREKSLPDISELDIKSQKVDGLNDDFDFFQDMEPVIETTTKFVVPQCDSNKLDMGVNNVDNHEEGWDDESGWGD